MRILAILFAVVAVQGATGEALAQATFDEWVRQRAATLAGRRLAAEQMDRDKDVEAPSIARSTSLVDQTDAPDLIGLAMSLYDAASDDSDKAPITVTLSAWSLRNAITHDDPLDPAVYANGGNWRRLSFSVGRELQDGGGQARILGAKVLLFNGRDVSAAAHKQKLENLNDLLPGLAKALADIRGEIEEFLVTTLRDRVALTATDALERKAEFLNTHLADKTFASTLELLTDEELAELDGIVIQRVPIDEALRTAVKGAIDDIRGAPQLAVTYQARLLPEGGSDEHRWQAVFDWGATEVFKLAVNASADVKKLGDADDERGGRLAFELTWAAGARMSSEERTTELLRTRRTRDKSPLALSVSAEGEWRSSKRPIGKLQAKVTVPLPALKGLSLPVSVTWANDPNLIDENDVRGQVGFTLDFAQLKGALTSFGQ